MLINTLFAVSSFPEIDETFSFSFLEMEKSRPKRNKLIADFSEFFSGDDSDELESDSSDSDEDVAAENLDFSDSDDEPLSRLVNRSSDDEDDIPLINFARQASSTSEKRTDTNFGDWKRAGFMAPDTTFTGQIEHSFGENLSPYEFFKKICH